MRNLELLHSSQIASLSELEGCQDLMSVDYDTGHIYLSTRDSRVVCLDPQAQEILWTLSLVEQGYASSSEGGVVVAIQHLPDQQSVCLATAGGDVLLYNILSCELECMGSVESGLTSMTWSPDQQLLILSTGAATLILMTKDFDPVIETAMHPREFGEQQPITVGWGKKETQFHGTAGKQAAVKTVGEVKPALAWDDMKLRVSWRGDGQFFAVSAVSPCTGVRKLRIWSRDCILQYTSEDLNGLEQALSWKPSGSLIASSQKLEDRHNVVFFEKNGLRHGEFTLPFDKRAVKVCEILWNTESSVLAVWLEELNSDSERLPLSYVQLWTVSNYHWYLKQSLDFPAADRLAAMQWDPEHGYRLHILTKSARYLQYTWSWATNRSRGTDCSDDACVAVIDGDRVLMTPFRKMVVPPPMSAYTIHLPRPVNQVCFAPPPHSNKMAALMSDGRIAIYVKSAGDEHSSDVDPTVCLVAAGGNGFKAMVTPHALKALLSIEDESGGLLVPSYPSQYHHLLWVSSQTFVLISSDPGGMGSTLHHVSLTDGDLEKPKLCVKSQSTIFGQVYRVTCDPSTQTLAVQLADGSVVTPDNDPIVKLPQPCTQMALCSMDGQEVILGLTERYRFYVNDTEFASNCTSFAVHDEYLLLTTHSHTCRCISLNSNPKDLVTTESKSLDESVRRVERGSRIVAVVPGDTRLVLQMPRGNLETVHPRGLVLSAIKKLLGGLKYREAFMVMKRHRINLNLFYDHDPKAFFVHIDHFVRELDSAPSLNLFLADLNEEDTTQTLYSAAYSRSPETAGTAVGSKVDAVCVAVRESVDRIDPNKFFLSLLTAHIKKSQPELEIALQRIQQLTQPTRRGAGGEPSPNPCPGSGSDCPTPDEALRYLILLVDVNQLFDVALGTYDFGLVLMVAEKSQKDPKEYLPFLNQLRSLETNYQCYTIDKHLRRYGKALRHISRCPGDERFAECAGLVAEHKLYSEALQLFERGSERYKAIGVAYGDYLQSKNRYADAALVFTLCSQWERALEMHSKSGQWQEAFCMASRLEYTADQLAETARKLAVYLSGHRRHCEAASILVEYADDVEEAISVLIAGGQWAESLRLMYKHNREDIIETHLKPALSERSSSTLASLENFLTTFDKHKKRLAAVRESKLRQDLEEGAGYNDVDADLYSDTSSVGGSAVGSVTSIGSSSSAYSTSTTGSKTSGRSRKNRRKAEQKKRSLKEGSKHEDLALLEALIEIIKNVDQLKGDVGHLLPILVMFDFREDAQHLQQSLQDALKVLEAGRSEIWTGNIAQLTRGATAGFGPQYTSNTIAASMTAPVPLGALPPTPSSSCSSPDDDAALFVPPKLSKDDKWRLHLLEPR